MVSVCVMALPPEVVICGIGIGYPEDIAAGAIADQGKLPLAESGPCRRYVRPDPSHGAAQYAHGVGPAHDQQGVAVSQSQLKLSGG